MHVVLRQPELVEIRTDGLGGNPGRAEIGDRGRAVPLRELRPVLAEQQPVMDELGRRAAERTDQLGLQLGVRAVVAASDDVRDLEVDVVHRARKLIGRRPVGAQQRRAAETQCALGVGLADLMRGLAMADEAAALVDRPFVPAHAEPLEIGGDLVRAALEVPRLVGVVDPQEQRPAALVGEIAVGDRAQGVTEMERAGRAGSEAQAHHLRESSVEESSR